MNSNLLQPKSISPFPELLVCFERQRAAYLSNPVPTYRERIDDLKTLAEMLKKHRSGFIEAINLDYGNRSEFETLFAEFFVVIESINDAMKNLKRWMRPQRRKIDFIMYPGARNRVIPQPLGVVGVIVPWNFPLNLTFAPLAPIFAAGNRAMIKMSENSRHLAEFLMDLTPQYFPEDKLRIFDDGHGRGPAFSSIPFDHLLFTGSGSTGRSVMANAAANLTPVTLELGGKSPAIIAPDFPIETAAERILWVKMFNAGQICTNVDYVFLPEGTETRFAEHCKHLIAKWFPNLNGDEYTSIIDAKSYSRLHDTLEDARAKGAELVNLAGSQQLNASLRKFPPHLVINPSDDMLVLQREIFGPILPVITYKESTEVARYINNHDRPLALYPFTRSRAMQDYYISNVMSGGVSVNDALLHVAQHDLPFGGVGASGMGHYHSREGFNTFSKLRPVFYQGPFSGIQLFFQPPYARHAKKILNALIKLKL